MTDRKLLELAAKAAGYDLLFWSDKAAFKEAPHATWNPLIDDGDALRLAVKLHIDIQFLPDAVRCKAPGTDWIGETCAPCDTEHLGVAHRRAIVRTAAEIGKQL